MSDEPDARDPVGEDKRIDSLEERLRVAQDRELKRTKSTASPQTDRLGSRVLADLIGGIGGGAFLGWVIDHFAGTSPWGLLVMMFFGIIVAFRNIIRISTRRPD